MLKKIDWYIAKKFLVTFFVTIILFVVIIIVFDFAEKLDDFLEHKAPISGIIFIYYANFIPNLINTFSPIFIFIAVLYFTSRLASRSEFISMLAGGMSLVRILKAYFFVAVLLAILSFVLNAWIIPRTDKARVKFDNMYLRDYWSQTSGTIYRQLKPGLIMYMEYFNNNDSTGVAMQLEKFDEKRQLQSTLFARYFKWNKALKKWHLEMVSQREFLPNGEQKIKQLPFLDTLIVFNANDFFFKIEDVQSLNMAELRNMIKAEKIRGSTNVAFLQTELSRRYAAPFTTFVLVLIGVCVAGRKTRGGLGFSLAVGIFVIIFFLFFQKYFVSMGQTGVIAPWVAAWAPNLLFVPVALLFYRYAQK